LTHPLLGRMISEKRFSAGHGKCIINTVNAICHIPSSSDAESSSSSVSSASVDKKKRFKF